ncbi:MAG: type II toxin-antitoxin system RelE/ParE family toxin [Verrucomicrobia bacterium]|nr:MAG: type II toxin-antitoxin system RelE/ParE family toxin [Verrucomicrobiota bacterium]
MKIVWTKTALTDLEEIKAYISKDSVYSALYVVEGILGQVALLADMPQAGHRVPESTQENLREIHSMSYRIIYSTSPDGVHILTVVHMARCISDFDS